MGIGVWDADVNGWPSNGDDRDKLLFLLRFAILAPSGHNTQPWLFKVSENILELFADRTRCLPVVDPDDRELIMSCGCALYFFKLAAKRFGYFAEIEYFPESSSEDLLARVRIVPSEPANNYELNMFSAISERHTNRQAFDDRKPSQETIDELVSVVNDEGTWLQIVTGRDKRHAIAELIAEGDRIQASNKHFRRELSSWVHPNRSKQSDGMPGYAFGVGDIASNLGPFILRTFDWGNGQAAKDHQLALGSPILAVLGSQLDTQQSWLSTGQALAKLLLHITTEGMSASFLNQPIETESLRNKVQEIIRKDGFPQIILRIGYGPKAKPTPRREIENVLIIDNL